MKPKFFMMYLCVICLGIFPGSVFPQHKEETSENIEQKHYTYYREMAERLYKRYNEFDAAEIVLDKILEYYPDDFEANQEYVYAKSEIFEKKGEIEKAINIWKNFMEKYKEDKKEAIIPKMSRSLMVRKNYLTSSYLIYQRAGRFNDALYYADKLSEFWLLEQDPFDIGFRSESKNELKYYANVDVNIYKTECYLGLKEYDRAISVCKEIIKTYSDKASLPETYSEGQKDGAWYDLKITVPNLMARDYLEKGVKQEAKKIYLQLKNISPDKEFGTAVSRNRFNKLMKEDVEINLKKCE